jgi:H+-translocating NAD(P) transhydrogenase subunit alpha
MTYQNQLPIAVKNATEISKQAQELADSLKEIVMSNAAGETVISGVDPFVFAITVFILSCFIGYYVVWKVTPALHTPLMSITNAISGIIIIGAMIEASAPGFSILSLFGHVAMFFAAINIFGGFIVTERMLEMFKKK